MKRKLKKGSICLHFKGGKYRVLIPDAHWHEDSTLISSLMVVYESLKTHKVCVRPYDMFMSEVDHEKYPDVEQRYRFEILD